MGCHQPIHVTNGVWSIDKTYKKVMNSLSSWQRIRSLMIKIPILVAHSYCRHVGNVLFLFMAA